MNKIQLVSDTSCDFTLEEAKQNDVKLVSFSVTFDEKTYMKELIDLTSDDMYNQMVNNPGVYPKSSTPNVNDYFEVFEEAVKAGDSVICLCITQKFSGSYQIANLARNMILDEYPDAKVAIIDSIINTVAQGELLLQMIQMRNDGLSYDEIIAKTEEIKSEGRIFFTVGDLDYLAHGGRIGRLSSFIGNSLQLKPLIVLFEGDIHSEGIAIGRGRSLGKVIDAIIKYFRKRKLDPNGYSFSVGYGYDKDEAMRFLDNFVKEFKKIGYTIQCRLAKIGATIAVHTGPYPLGVGICKKYNC